MADADELAALFSPTKPLEPDVLAELQSMTRLYGLSAEDLFFKWEAYCIRMDRDLKHLEMEFLRGLKHGIQGELESRQRQAHHAQPRGGRVKRRPHATPKPDAKAAAAGVLNLLDGISPSLPTATSPASQKRPASGSGGTAKRKMDEMLGLGTSHSDKANPIIIFNDKLPPAKPPPAPFAKPRVKLTAASDQNMSYKPLAMKLSEASEILDDRIDEFVVLIQDYHGLDEAAFGNTARQATSEIVAVGRIASDSSTGKLNAASLVLETSRRTGQGFRVPLCIDAIPSWSLFPGQIVAVRGINATGNEFVVSQVLDIPLLPAAASTLDALNAHRERLAGDPDAMDSDTEPAPLSVVFASGPYTADDNLNYAPLHALCDQADDMRADALVLTGPFIDTDHPLIASGDFDLAEEANYDADTATMTTVFRKLVAPALNRLCASNPHLVVILVPSVRDVLDKHVSWPQDAIPRKELGLPKAARLVSNPMTLSINEMVLGVSSLDVLFELRSEELTRAAAPGQLIGRLCRHLVEQRHFFPLFPPTDRARLPPTGTAEGIATGAMLDLSYLKLGEILNVRPDVLLVPSALPPFIETIESVLVINPGPLSKRKGAGTYARMYLDALRTTDVQPTAGVLGHRIFERARVEIVRI